MKTFDVISSDGTRLRAGLLDHPHPKGDVLLVHGFAEHLGRYQWVMQGLHDAGWRVTFVELRGHGHSDGQRGHVASWSNYVEDVRTVSRTLPGPYFLMAHSMGGLVALDHLRDARDTVKGVLLSGPLLGFRVKPALWKLWSARLLSKIWPTLLLDSEIDAKWICTDPAVVTAYKEDPLIGSKLTPRWFTEMKKALTRVHDDAPKMRTPLYIAWGTEDQITSPPDITDYISRYGGPSETQPWDGLYHEILNEPVREKVLAGYVSALNKWAGV